MWHAVIGTDSHHHCAVIERQFALLCDMRRTWFRRLFSTRVVFVLTLSFGFGADEHHGSICFVIV